MVLALFGGAETASAIAPVPPAALNSNAASDSGDDDVPSVATDGAGNWVAVWTSAEDLGGTIGTDKDILVSRSSDDGATWTAPAELHSHFAADDGNDQLYSPLATDGAGNWLVVWASHDDLDDLGWDLGPDSDILCSRSTDNGATWSAPAPVNSDAETDRTDSLGSDGHVLKMAMD
ncbi:MAG: hypothetical protein GWN66_11330, partial [Pseudomonas stutzeri]|nr:hypothetical protein [Stutzerimonas stutzeri]